MGWKNVKEHYKIGHYVQVTDKGICIGSPYIHDIIVIGLDGTIKKGETTTHNADLIRYQTEMLDDPEKLRQLVQSPDSFSQSIPVYTYDGGEIIEKQCETLGWPNVTHDGLMMYENTFSTDKDVVIAWAKANAESAIKWTLESIEQKKRELESREADLSKYRNDLKKLEALGD